VHALDDPAALRHPVECLLARLIDAVREIL